MFVKRVFSRVGVRNSLLISGNIYNHRPKHTPNALQNSSFLFSTFKRFFCFALSSLAELILRSTQKRVTRPFFNNFSALTNLGVIAAETAYYWKRERTRAEAQETNGVTTLFNF